MWEPEAHLEVLIREGTTIDGLAASAVATLKVPTLNDEVLDDAVKRAALVAKSRLAACW